MARLVERDGGVLPSRLLSERNLKVMSRKSKTNPGAVTRITQEGGAYTIVMRHDFGPKWSIVVESALQEFVRKMFGVEPRITAGESVVTARFKADPRKIPT